MMSRLVGNTVPQRKKSLASLVEQHFNSLGHNAKMLENRTNTKGCTDLVVVDSDIGLVHLTATGNTEPNASISVVDKVERHQDFLADKVFVAYGWNTRDNRTMIFFVPVSSVAGKESLTKNEINRLSEFHVVLS